MLLEPDGSTRIVEYYADSVNGFNANVRTIDGPLYYGGAGIDDDLMMMDQKLLEKQRIEFELQQKLQMGQGLELQQKLQMEKKLELQQQLELQQLEMQQLEMQQQLQMQGKKELLLNGATGFSYSNQVVHH